MKKEVNHIVFQLWTKAFFQQHAIILGLVYLVMFGAVEGSQLLTYHLKLIEGTFSETIALFIIMLIWLFYFFRVLFFLGQVIENKQNLLLQQITLLQNATHHFILFKVIGVCILPISTYALVMLGWGILHGYYYEATAIFFLFILMHWFGVRYLRKKLTNYDFTFRTRSLLPASFFLPMKHPFQIYLKYIRNTQKLQWFVVKLIMVLTIGMNFSGVFPGDELRFSIFFYAMILLMHTNLIRQFIIWENTAFWHSTQMPITNFMKWCNYLLFFMVLLLPECILIIRTFPDHLTYKNMIGILLLSIGLLLVIYAVCIAFNNITTDYMPVIFLVLLGTYIAALADIIIPFSIVLLVASYLIFNKSVGKFELQFNKEQDAYT